MKLSALSKNTRLKKICLWTAGIIGIYAILGFLAAPPVVRSLLTKQFTKEFGQPVTIRKIHISPFTLEARVDGFALADRPGQRPLFAFDELYCNLDLLSVIRLAPVLTAVHLTRPRFHIIRYADHGYNFSAPVNHYLSIPSTGSAPGFSFSDIRVSSGRIDFDDRETRARHDLTDINVEIPFLSDLKRDIDVQVKPSFSAKIDGRPIELKAKSQPFRSTRETGLEFNLDGLDISKYMKYAPATLKFRVPSGLLDADLFVSFTHTQDAGALLRVSGKAAVTNAAITGTDNAPLFKFSRLDVGIDSIKFPKNVIDIKRIRLTDPEVFATRARDGKINLATAFATRRSNSSAKTPPRTAPATTTKSKKPAAMVFAVDK
ncbi:MAG: AsmA family protein, partial [Terriglobia bacterium]